MLDEILQVVGKLLADVAISVIKLHWYSFIFALFLSSVNDYEFFANFKTTISLCALYIVLLHFHKDLSREIDKYFK